MATEELQKKELIKKRGSFKGRLTAFANYLDALGNKPLSSSDATELQLRTGKMESLYEQYDEVQLKLEIIVEDDKAQLCERSEFESLYYKMLSKSQLLLNEYNKDNESANSDKNTCVSNSRNLVQLPTIYLPKFDGSFNDWLEFRDTFISLIHNNDDIQKINKFHYLRSSLEGSAAVVLRSIEFSGKNYDVAWKLLCDRFDNKRLLIENHVKGLFNVNAINKESSVALNNLIDSVNKSLRSLELLGEPVDKWDTLLIYIITRKLDQRTYREWLQHRDRVNKDSTITFNLLINFLRNRASFMETLESPRNDLLQTPNRSNTKLKTLMVTSNSNSSGNELVLRSCPHCKGDHNLGDCSKFLSLSVQERLKLVPSFKVCYNCFRSGHFANQCKKPGCKLCKRRHNILIHLLNNNNTKLPITPSASSGFDSGLPTSSQDKNNVVLSAMAEPNCGGFKQRGVLLSTALIKLYDRNSDEHVVRAVLDSGSTSSFMTERLQKRLNLAYVEVDRSIIGINNVTSYVGKACQVDIKSLDNSFQSKLYCFVLPFITNDVPCHSVNFCALNIPPNIRLADPSFYKPSEIDILIGADLFWDLLGTQRIKLGDGMPVLCDTRLGWIVSGPIMCQSRKFSNSIKCNLVNVNSARDSDLDKLRCDLAKFWQLEEVKSSSSHSPEEKLCEEHFIKNTTRLSDGRFCVHIPLKESPSVLGDSFRRASQCLYSLERRLKSQPVLKGLYYDFMSEYEKLGHMTECENSDLCQSGYFIPHHGVLRECSSTTKLRVVFNASSPTSSGTSFNDLQMTGPTVQDDLLSILIRFRTYKYVLSADVEKMYRQIVVHPSNRHLQQIVWRDDVKNPVRVYRLNTVTYGTASAPYLATRCLKQVGLDCKNKKIADVIIHDFYVDDLLTGANDVDELLFIRQEVTNALASACMPLRKWKSNDPRLVSDSDQPSFNLNMESDFSNRLLGLDWFVSSDELGYLLGSTIPSKGNTKRELLSVIARIFDPLGLLSPCVITMKMLLQKMWIDKLSWDEPLCPELCVTWTSILESLPELNNFRVPRNVVCDSYEHLELHIFTDASEKAYGACAYVRSVNKEGKFMVRLLIGKSRVAPIKTTTIPRLELCGALIGARVYEKVLTSLRMKISDVFLWTDSTIVLGWLHMSPSKLQPFVRNRVAEILDKTINCTWRHVPTDKNPADLISRGANISTLRHLNLWWYGPDFLKEDQSCWPTLLKHTSSESLPDIRQLPILGLITDNVNKENRFIDFNRFSNYSRLLRCMAYVLRFIKSCKGHKFSNIALCQEEIHDALNKLIIKSQEESFTEYRLLINKKVLPKKSSLLKFNVYLDENNLMRVGGRLDNSTFCYNKKHPILLQSTHHFTKLLFSFEHKRLLHAGPQMLLASIRETYWPIGGRNLAKACYYKCIRCQRFKGKTVTPIMGNLPQQRLIPGGYAFENVGVDYAGPIMYANRQGRGCRLVKAYIAVFICFCTKAIHLETVGDLTSNKFLLALNRFIARRGKPINIYSDNGTSFTGAYNDLSKFLKSNCSSISENMANDNIQFHFIPAYTPHFGGLWEAGVKSTKYHLKRVLGNCNLTFEELATTLTQIEAVLNSRPLTPLSSDPADCTPLTPGHFLIGRPMTSLPTPNYQDCSANYLSRFQRLEQLRQHFWSRWSKEFIAELQQRTKWRSCKDSLKLDSLVVIKEDNLPPLKWKLGRVVAVHPGSDGVIRVADIRTTTGIIRRAFNTICPLPVLEDSG